MIKYNTAKVFFILLIAFELVNPLSYAQIVSDVHFEQIGDTINIYYDLQYSEPEELFVVQLFYDNDNTSSFNNNLIMVSGDIGAKVKCGKGKKIVWDYLKEVEAIPLKPRFRIECSKFTTFQIGQFYQGGIIFYLDATGSHGLIATPCDLPDQYSWGCWRKPVSGTQAIVGSGQTNTNAIVKQCDEPNNAAKVCDDLKMNYKIRVI